MQILRMVSILACMGSSEGCSGCSRRSSAAFCSRCSEPSTKCLQAAGMALHWPDIQAVQENSMRCASRRLSVHIIYTNADQDCMCGASSYLLDHCFNKLYIWLAMASRRHSDG
jgi:hypothetical protein